MKFNELYTELRKKLKYDEKKVDLEEISDEEILRLYVEISQGG